MIPAKKSLISTATTGDSAEAVARALRMLGIVGTTLDYEKILEAGYRRFLGPGCYVVDVGAHVGDHLQHFVKLIGDTGRAIAFEPIPDKADELRKWFAGWPNTEIHNCALGKTRGTEPFQHITNMPHYSGLQKRDFAEQGAKVETIQVKVDTLDNALGALPRLDFVKIDVEGGEMDCLMGAVITLARHRPIISIEYGHGGYSKYGHTKQSLLNFTAANGYLISDLFGNIIAPDQWERICDGPYWDYFLVPDEKVEWWRELFAH